MNAHVCGLWDGTSLWLQWDDVAPEAGYMLRLRLRQAGQAGWNQWIPIEPHRPYRRSWIVIPTWKHGMEAQAEVAVAPDGAWVTAQEVTFLRSTCLFSFVSLRRPLLYPVGSVFHAVVDGAACHYALEEALELAPGTEARVTMVAASTSGYCQLDRPGDFKLAPTLGLTIENLEASVDDLQPTGRDVTMIAVLPREEPLRIVLGGRPNPFVGTVEMRNA